MRTISFISIFTVINLTLCFLYYVACWWLNLPPVKQPYVIEIPMMLIVTFSAPYVYANRYKINFSADINNINQVSDGKFAKWFAYIASVLVTGVWVGKVCCHIFNYGWCQ